MVTQQIGIADKKTLDEVKQNTINILNAGTGVQTIHEYMNIQRNSFTVVNGTVQLITLLDIDGEGILYEILANADSTPQQLRGFALKVTVDDVLIYDVYYNNSSSTGFGEMGITSFRDLSVAPNFIIPATGNITHNRVVYTLKQPIKFNKLKIEASKTIVNNTRDSFVHVIYELEG